MNTASRPGADLAIRTADLADLDAVEALEEACFELDGQSRRSLRHLIARAQADFLLALLADQIVADVIVLYRRGTTMARLYSIAVGEAARGRGVARALLDAGEARARNRGCRGLRAEVRRSNASSRALFARAGYRECEALPGYYPGRDGSREDGIRLEKIFT
jgi:ribosomal protein S18 acetylase RimI-like enzyme